MRRLKDKIFRDIVIKIDCLIEQTKDGYTTGQKCVAYLVTIEHGYGRKTMFRANSKNELYKMIDQEGRLWPIQIGG